MGFVSADCDAHDHPLLPGVEARGEVVAVGGQHDAADPALDLLVLAERRGDAGLEEIDGGADPDGDGETAAAVPYPYIHMLVRRQVLLHRHREFLEDEVDEIAVHGRDIMARGRVVDGLPCLFQSADREGEAVRSVVFRSPVLRFTHPMHPLYSLSGEKWERSVE